MLVFALVLVALTSSIISSTGAELQIRERDQATVTAYNALALAAAESCGEVVTGTSGRSGCYDKTTWSASASLIPESEESSSPGFKESSIPESAESLVSSATVVTRWACSTTDPSTTTATTKLCPWKSTTAPNSLERTVTVTWPHSGTQHTLTVTSYTSVPSADLGVQAGANGYVPGGIVECGLSAGATVSLTSTTPAVSVTRTVNGQGDVWFPFLPPDPSGSATGSYTLGSSSSTILVTAGQLTAVGC